MKKKIVEVIDRESIVFDFNGFDDGHDFVRISRIIKESIKPEKSEFWGLTDMRGYFVKEGIEVEVEYTIWLGNCLKYKGPRKEETLNKIRSWAQTIFDLLQKEEK